MAVSERIAVDFIFLKSVFGLGGMVFRPTNPLWTGTVQGGRGGGTSGDRIVADWERGGGASGDRRVADKERGGGTSGDRRVADTERGGGPSGDRRVADRERGGGASGDRRVADSEGALLVLQSA